MPYTSRKLLALGDEPLNLGRRDSSRSSNADDFKFASRDEAPDCSIAQAEAVRSLWDAQQAVVLTALCL
jgi:hypothetical protein